MELLVVALWYAGAAAKAYAAFCLWRQRLIERLPTLFALLVVLAVQSIIALTLAENHARYAQVFTLIAWTEVLAEGFAVAGVFWTLTEFYPKFRIPGSILLSVLALLGAAICWAAGYLAPPPGWSADWHSAFWAQRAISLVMLCVLAGTRLFLPKVRGIPIRPVARRAADILTVRVGLTLASAGIGIATGLRYPAVVSLIVVLNGLAFGVLCAVFLTGKSDKCPADGGWLLESINPVFKSINPALKTAKPALKTAKPALKTAKPALKTAKPALKTAKPALKSA